MTYPNTTGYKDPTVSRDNAKAMDDSGRTATLKARVLALYETGFEGTADEAAANLGESILAIRPRCSELRRAGKLFVTGRRRGVPRKAAVLCGRDVKLQLIGLQMLELGEVKEPTDD